MTEPVPQRFQEILTVLNSGRFALVMARSPEERSTACAKLLFDQEKIPYALHLIDYPRLRRSPDKAETVRLRQQDTILRSGIRRDPIAEDGANPFAYNQLSKQIRSFLNRYVDLPIVFDFTCMTIVHLLALVSVLEFTPRRKHPVYLCYTTPRFYGFERIGYAGWKDVLFVPLGEPHPATNEGYARGLVLAGHDAERLGVALQEYEPDGGIVLYTMTRDRPDFLQRGREVNEMVVKRLLSLRIPGTGKPAGVYAWEERGNVLDDPCTVVAIVKRLATSAIDENGPLVLFPFGPKLTILTAAMAICSHAGLSSWAVCPIPTAYLADTSFGSGDIYCIRHD